jgi:UDP-4-amino-4-deoxy-L-arabinose formyltransferase/UDP-glucuronic acid dehydrogenase (UDP-4-keto-hexauronic acid decarboxylating)
MKIVVFCTLSTGLSAIQHAIDQGLQIAKIIGLYPDKKRDTELISGIIDIAHFCKSKAIKYSYVSDYTLKSESPNIIGSDIDLIWVCGWQRLIPNSFISATRYGAVGAHGSCDGISKGRGRSPQNWALLIGAKSFEISLFKITPDIDNGKIITTDCFELTKSDNIQTSYIKSAMLIAKSLNYVFQNPIALNKGVEQSGIESYFPKRIPEDGFIDWNMTVTDIHNQVRALADPYPNSRTSINGFTVLIKRSIPIICDSKYTPGYIVDILANGSLLVAANDGFLLIEEFQLKDSIEQISAGKIFQSYSIQNTVIRIVERFKNEFPNKKINQSLINFWKQRGVKLNID